MGNVAPFEEWEYCYMKPRRTDRRNERVSVHADAGDVEEGGDMCKPRTVGRTRWEGTNIPILANQNRGWMVLRELTSGTGGGSHHPRAVVAIRGKPTYLTDDQDHAGQPTKTVAG